MSIEMRRDDRDVWPDDVPVGIFDIVQHGLQDTSSSLPVDGITAHIVFVCPGSKRCGVFVGPAHIGRKSPDDLVVWQWDGNLEKPTLTPSINCVGGCGAHFFITAGVMG